MCLSVSLPVIIYPYLPWGYSCKWNYWSTSGMHPHLRQVHGQLLHLPLHWTYRTPAVLLWTPSYKHLQTQLSEEEDSLWVGGADAPAPPSSNQSGALSQIDLDHHGIIKQLELASIIIMQQQQEQAPTATSRRRTTKLLTDYPCISNK